jgi:hypothetical protein
MYRDELWTAAGSVDASEPPPVLKAAVTMPDVPAGFHGATPYEIAARFAAGRITRDQLIDELARWPYKTPPRTDGVDWRSGSTVGTWDDVVIAMGDNLIDTETYEAVMDRQDELGTAH